MKCYRCQSENSIKSGFTAGRQRYKYKECSCFYSVEKKSNSKTDEQKRLALQLYLKGMSFHAIGIVLNISYVTIFKWIKKWGEQTELPKSKEPIQIVELDEIYTYVQHKKTTAGSGLLLIDLDGGSSILFAEKEIR